MHPILFKLGPLNIYSYGVMVALGFTLATICIYIRGPKFGIDREHIVDLTIIMLVSGILGARLFYVFQNLDYYIANPREIANLSRGGLVWYGAFISGLVSTAIYIKRKGLELLSSLDLAAPYIALGQAIGRIGCFLNGCCYGVEAGISCPVAVIAASDGVLRHPAQIYSAASLVMIFIILRVWQDHRRFKGEIFLGYCMLYSFKRFLMEFVRGDNPRIAFGLTISQIISCVIFTASLAVFLGMTLAWKKKTFHSR